MSWDIELAKMLKERENPKVIGPTIGRVISISPFKVGILDGHAILDKTHLYITGMAKNKAFAIGDEILLIPSESEQKFFLIDKIERMS